MKKQIELPSRDGHINYLNRIGGEGSKTYSITPKYYASVGLLDNDPYNYSFLDPSGGPFIRVGSKIEDYTVKSIYSEKDKDGFLIEFE